jgi:NTE family protein
MNDSNDILGGLAGLAGALVALLTPLPPPPRLPVRRRPRPPVPVRVGLVLGGGGVRGFAHIGVIRVLEEEGIPVDVVVGTSVGSLIGAVYAARPDAAVLEREGLALDRGDFLDYTLFGLGWGPLKGRKLERLVDRLTEGRPIETFPIPFAAVATDIRTGERVVLDRGPAGRAVWASSAMPGLIHPCRMDGRLLADGALIENLPVSVAREKGAEVVIAVNISPDIEATQIRGAMDVLHQAIAILGRELTARQPEADLTIAPEVGHIATLDFKHKRRAVEAGKAVALDALPGIWDTLAVAASRLGRPWPDRKSDGTGSTQPRSAAPMPRTHRRTRPARRRKP